MVKAGKESTTVVPQIRLKLPKFEADNFPESAPHDANAYFARMFPESATLFGPGFLQANYSDGDGLPRFVPVELNIDFFAHAIGGDRRMAHKVVFYAFEETFYFFEPRLDAYCPTSEEKLEALLSNYLVRCAQDCGWLVEIRPLFSEFREHNLLKKVIKRAKALLAADQSFFTGEKGERRLVDGKIVNPTDKPSYALFVERTLVRKSGSAFTVTDAFSRYFQFCQVQSLPPFTRAEFKALVAEVIREQFQLGLRRDLVVDESGKQQEGWQGLACNLEGFVTAGRN